MDWEEVIGVAEGGDGLPKWRPFVHRGLTCAYRGAAAVGSGAAFDSIGSAVRKSDRWKGQPTHSMLSSGFW